MLKKLKITALTGIAALVVNCQTEQKNPSTQTINLRGKDLAQTITLYDDNQDGNIDRYLVDINDAKGMHTTEEYDSQGLMKKSITRNNQRSTSRNEVSYVWHGNYVKSLEKVDLITGKITASDHFDKTGKTVETRRYDKDGKLGAIFHYDDYGRLIKEFYFEGGELDHYNLTEWGGTGYGSENLSTYDNKGILIKQSIDLDDGSRNEWTPSTGWVNRK